jgi:single-stranded-DNA-specific exonuclease
MQASASQSLALDLALAPGGLTPGLVDTLESAGPYGMGWPGPRVAVGPVQVVKADVVGRDHVRLIVRGADGGSFKAMAFRQAESDMGQTLLHARRDRRLWLAGRAKIDDWGSRPAAELHIDDAAFAD